MRASIDQRYVFHEFTCIARCLCGSARRRVPSRGRWRSEPGIAGATATTTRATSYPTARDSAATASLRASAAVGAATADWRAGATASGGTRAAAAAHPRRGCSRIRRTPGYPAVRLQHRAVRGHRRARLRWCHQLAPVDLLDRRRHRGLRQRAPIPAGLVVAAGRRRAHRGADQLLRLRLPAPGGGRTLRHRHRDGRRPVGTDPPARAHRPAVDAGGDGRSAAQQPRLPARRVGVDERRRQAAAAQGGARPARRTAPAAGPGDDRRLRRGGGDGVAAHLRRAEGDDTRQAVWPRGGRFDGRRGPVSALPTSWRASGS